MAMGENVISEIVSKMTASGIWSKLENLYLKKTLTNRLLLTRSCLFFKMKEGATIKSHMTEFEDIVMKLNATDTLLAIDEEALAMILLNSKTRGNCNYCHKPGHWVKDCPSTPSSTPSLSGGKYFVSFIDDFSHTLWVYVLKLKSDVFETFKTWVARVEVKNGKKLKVLRCDNGGEFTTCNFKDFCSSKGIHRHYTTPGDPKSNGVAERMNRTLLEKV
ncbi:hypothetical protein OSB04_028813 [Centaurea solstitialis]|uniref:Retrovirus-related Pol polyprotein from transposon TNT 1-94 n=1 Tax=Centaurea solstitialis TaxID=347529 RepID=A0AA38T021_9ASTR|nr:hypothetical protein OSB04_028813 [Centaurea solstitialis]